MKKLKERISRIKKFITTILTADNYIMIGINDKPEPDIVSFSYIYHANIEIMQNCFVEILRHEAKKESVIKEVNKIINSPK